MSELSDDTELQTHSRAVLYILSAVAPPRARETTEVITSSFVDAIKSSTVCASLVYFLLPLMRQLSCSNGESGCMPYQLWSSSSIATS